MVFQILKPACLLCTTFVLTVIKYSDIWSLVAAVELFIKTGLVTAIQQGFRQQFQRHDAPSHNTLLLWVSKRHQEGSVKESKPQGCPFSALAT